MIRFDADAARRPVSHRESLGHDNIPQRYIAGDPHSGAVADPLEIAQRVTDAALGASILALLVYLAYLWQRNGTDFAIARMGLRKRNTQATISLSVLGFAMVVFAKGLELYAAVNGVPWILPEGSLESLSLIFVFVALLVFIPVLHVPRRVVQRPAER